jgi:hypothetical protein
MTTSSSSVLVVGEHDVGKTVFGIQLFGRMQAKRSVLRLSGAPKSIAIFEVAIAALNEGKAPIHTSSGFNKTLILPTELNGQRVDLEWPDYAGEQVSNILKTRALSADWHDHIAASDAWMLFLRLASHSDAVDAIQRPSTSLKTKSRTQKAHVSPEPTAQDENTLKPWNSNARYIELLQMLLYAKGIGVSKRISQPPLAIMLSCWDELNTDAPPREVLKKRLPLFSTFLENIWHPDRFEVFGVSAAGGPLEIKSANTKMRDEGPENHGYVVLPTGVQNSDLSVPVVWLVDNGA